MAKKKLRNGLLRGGEVLEAPAIERLTVEEELAEVLRVAEEAADCPGAPAHVAGEEVEGRVVEVDPAEDAPLRLDRLISL